MNCDEAIELLTSGKEGVEEWDEWRWSGEEELPDFISADLSSADLTGANLTGANFRAANFSNANLRDADLSGAHLVGADLSGADLSGANFTDANFSRADLSDVNLSGARFGGARFGGANFSGANFSNAKTAFTTFASVILSDVVGLEEVVHGGRSSLGIDTMVLSGGTIPESFLRGCGLSPWQIAFAALHDPHLSDVEISELVTTKLCTARMQGPLYIGGVFISYSHADSEFTEKIRSGLYDEGASVWLDKHDLVAGKLTKQIERAVRLQDIVVIVLSETSLASDWVWQEIEWARTKEEEEGRDVLCPVALDETWKTAAIEPVLMRQLKHYNVLDFSGWKTKKFSKSFAKLVAGMKTNYELRAT